MFFQILNFLTLKKWLRDYQSLHRLMWLILLVRGDTTQKGRRVNFALDGPPSSMLTEEATTVPVPWLPRG